MHARPSNEQRQHVGQRQQDAGRRERDRAESESPPADPVRDAAGDRPHEAGQPEDEDEARRGRGVRERGILEPIGDVGERADEREEQGGPSRPRRRAASRSGDAGRHRRPAAAGPARAARCASRSPRRAATRRGRRSQPATRRRRSREPPPADRRGHRRRATKRSSPSPAPRSVARMPRRRTARPTTSSPGMQSPCSSRQTRSASNVGARATPSVGGTSSRLAGADRTWSPDPVRDRAPGEPSDSDGEHDDRDREAGARRADVEIARELRQDRLRRVHRREHPGRSQHEAGERLPQRIRSAHPHRLRSRRARSARTWY